MSVVDIDSAQIPLRGWVPIGNCFLQAKDAESCKAFIFAKTFFGKPQTDSSRVPAGIFDEKYVYSVRRLGTDSEDNGTPIRFFIELFNRPYPFIGGHLLFVSFTAVTGRKTARYNLRLRQILFRMDPTKDTDFPGKDRQACIRLLITGLEKE